MPLLPATRAFRTLVLALVSAALSLGLACGLLAVSDARASTVPRSVCGAADGALGRGLCVADSRGSAFWLGTLRGYDGALVYCIDYAFSTRWGVPHRRVLVDGGLPTSIGDRVGPGTVAALNHLVTRHPADEAGDDVAAAIGLIIRQVMGDVRTSSGRPIPGGLSVATRVRDVAFVPDRIVTRARSLWDEARVHRGPWRLSVRIDPGPDGKVGLGETVTASVRARNGSGAPQPLTASIGLTGFTGPAQVRVGAAGTGSARLTAPRAVGAASVRLRVAQVPGAQPVIVRPEGWAANPRPGHASATTQRGLLGRQSSVSVGAAVSVQVIKTVPRVVTLASTQRAVVGESITDDVEISGTAGSSGSFAWSLRGPVPAVGGRCPGPGAAWEEAPVITGGTVPFQGDGRYRTPKHQVTREQVGCLTYVESLSETTTTLPMTTPPGVTEETVLVEPAPRSVPCVSTVASAATARVGAHVHDRVRIGCLAAGDEVVVRWTAHGPLSPLAGVDGAAGCRGIATATWRRAPVAARGSFGATGPGEHRTRPFLVRRPGCYTFSEQIAATSTSAAAESRPGLVRETTLVTRPPLVEVPVIPTGVGAPVGIGPISTMLRTLVAAVAEIVPAGPATFEPWLRAAPRYVPALDPSAAGVARRSVGTLRIPRLGVTAPVDRVPLRRGVMVVPEAPARLGWLVGSAGAADVAGASVIGGHVSDRRDRPGALALLRRLRAGDRILWTSRVGRVHRFAVTGAVRVPRAGGLPGWVFRTDGPHLLRVVTCAGRVRRPGGGFHYVDNLVVTARELR